MEEDLTTMEVRLNCTNIADLYEPFSLPQVSKIGSICRPDHVGRMESKFGAS
jgi:hypothetical protein